MDSPELRLIAPLVGSGALPAEGADRALRKWQALHKAGRPASLLAVMVHEGLLTKTQALVLARADLAERQPFRNYKILRKIGEGGMALVYEATYVPVKARIALKVLDTPFSLQEKYRLRFKREAGILLMLDHENIVEGREHISEDGIEAYAMGYVEGVAVLDLLEKGVRLPERLCLQIAAQVGMALEHMREKGVVHRDIKPGNFVLDHEGTVRIIDFGLAKLMSGMWADTSEETTVGTLEYMSPEQARGRSDVDIRADLYSLGCSLFQMVTGDLPFRGTASEVMFAHVKTDVDLTAEQRARCSPPVQYLLRRLMAKAPDDRYPTPQAFLDDLKALCGDVCALPVEVPAEVADTAVEAAPILNRPGSPAAPVRMPLQPGKPRRGGPGGRGGPPRRGR